MIIAINNLVIEIHKDAVIKGFWERENIPEKLALIHSEVSEALEDYRDGRMNTKIEARSEKPVGFPSELADIMIRVMDLAGYLQIDLETEIAQKMLYNIGRPYKHGGKRC